MKTIDMHVHMVGNAASGNGCWVRASGLTAPLYGLMLRKLGLCYSQLQSPEFDNLFRERLLGFIQESKINAVCLLAQEAVYHEAVSYTHLTLPTKA